MKKIWEYTDHELSLLSERELSALVQEALSKFVLHKEETHSVAILVRKALLYMRG